MVAERLVYARGMGVLFFVGIGVVYSGLNII